MSDNKLFSYTNRDYEGSRKEGLARIPELSNGVWTDLNVTDPGIIMLDYVHALVDMINYYQDHQALETFIPTAKERANIFRLAKQLAYRIRSAKSSQVTVTFHTDFYYDEIVKIPKYTSVYTKNRTNFITIEDAYLEAGKADVDVLCKQGELYTQKYEGTGLSRFSILEDTVSENQSVTLTAKNIDIDSIEIIDNLNRVWKPVDYIVYTTEYDRVYQAELNPDDTVTILFGDGERGIYPKSNEVLTISYIANDAEDGRIGAGAIVESENIYHEGKYVSFKVTNKEASIGGSSSQSSTSIRELAPGAIKAQGRAVTIEDFENLAKLIDGVSEAIAYDINIDPDMPFHEVDILIVPDSGFSDSDILLKEVYDYLYQRMIPPTNLVVSFPKSIPVDIQIEVKKFSDINDSTALTYEIEKLVKDYFNSRDDSIGSYFYAVDLATKISTISGIKRLISITPSVPLENDEEDRVSSDNTVKISNRERAVLRNLTINVQ